MVTKKVLQLLNIYPGEGKAALFFSLMAFLGALGVSCAATLSEGTFLEILGADRLAYTYVYSGIGMALLSFLLLKTFNCLKTSLIFFMFLAACVVIYLGLILFGDASLQKSEVFTFSFKVLTDLLFIGFTLCYWNYVDEYYDMQDAKRVYCFFNSAILLGTACGGALISETLPLIGAKGIYSIILISQVAAAILLLSTRFFIASTPSEHHYDAQEESCPRNIRQSLVEIIRSPFTLFFLSSFLISQVLLILATYGYMDSFERFYRAKGFSEGDLTTFLGSCTFWVAVGNMVFGSLFYSRLARWVGVYNLLLVTPSVFVVLYLGWSVSSLFIFGLLGLLAVEGLWFSLDENTFNVIVNAVPSKCKKVTRVFVDCFFEPLGMLLCGLLLLGLQNNAIPNLPIYVGFALSIALVGLILFMRHWYKSAILYNLSQEAFNFRKSSKEWLQSLSTKDRRTAYFHFLCLLRTRDSEAQIFAFRALLDFEDSRILPHLVNQLRHFSIRTRIKAIELLAESRFSSHKKVIDLMLSWGRTPLHPSLVRIAYSYLAKQQALPYRWALNAFTSQSLTFHCAGLSTLLEIPSKQEEALQALDRLLTSEQDREVCQGIKILASYSQEEALRRLPSFFNHPSSVVCQESLLAYATSLQQEEAKQAEVLLSHLPSIRSPDVREAILQVLRRFATPSQIRDLLQVSYHFLPREKRLIEQIIYEMGQDAASPLLELTIDSHFPARLRVMAGKVLGRLDPVKLNKRVIPSLWQDLEQAYFYIYHARELMDKESDSDLLPLKEILVAHYESHLDFIVQIIGVMGQVSDTETLSRSIHSNNHKIHSNALETLEKITNRKLFRALLPLIDDGPQENLKVAFNRKGFMHLSIQEVIQRLSDSPFVIDRIIATKVQEKESPNSSLEKLSYCREESSSITLQPELTV